jgi:hypothetical protein
MRADIDHGVHEWRFGQVRHGQQQLSGEKSSGLDVIAHEP